MKIKFLREIGKNTEIIPSHCISFFYKYKRELNDKLWWKEIYIYYFIFWNLDILVNLRVERIFLKMAEKKSKQICEKNLKIMNFIKL